MHKLDQLAQDYVEGRQKEMVTQETKLDAKASWFSYIVLQPAEMLDRMGYVASSKTVDKYEGTWKGKSHKIRWPL